MPEASDTLQARYDMLRRLRGARRDFHYALMRDAQTRERVFAPAHLLRTLREQVDQSSVGTTGERCNRLFVLAVLLYGALDWHYAGHGIDIEADVQLERLHQNDRYGGPQLDDRLSAKEWQTRMHHQVLRLEQQLAVEDLYAARLVKLAALVQAALEATSRQLRAA
ncbi:MAG TPA: hypothetical protein VGN31_22070 [Paraburkholderia sp.]